MSKKIILLPLLLFSAIMYSQEMNPDDYISILGKKTYQNASYDTAVFKLPADYPYAWLIIEGSDYDADDDGDYTDCLLIVNDSVLVDTMELARVVGVGRNGDSRLDVIDVHDIVHKGFNIIIFGSTEDYGQQDYVELESLDLLVSDRNFLNELAYQQTIENYGFEVSITEYYRVKRGQKIQVDKSFIDKYNYYICTFPANDKKASLSLTIVDQNGKVVEKGTKNSDGYVDVLFSPEKGFRGKIIVKVKSAEPGTIVDLWVYNREKE